VCDSTGNKNGNRRTANIRSVGYSDLFVLLKEDLWDALKEYPESKKMFLEKGRQILRKDNLLDEDVAEAAEASGTTDDRVRVVECKIDEAKTRLARLMAEVTVTTSKLNHRIAELNMQLSRLKAVEMPLW
jgi:cyclic nucleotide gated channel alpha 3